MIQTFVYPENWVKHLTWAAMLVFLITRGPDPVPSIICSRAGCWGRRGRMIMNARPRVVILGGGFAGLTAAQHLVGAELDVTVIDRHNYHPAPAAALSGRDS